MIQMNLAKPHRHRVQSKRLAIAGLTIASLAIASSPAIRVYADEGVTVDSALEAAAAERAARPAAVGVAGGLATPGLAGADGGFGDQVGTATGDILEARGDLAKDRGKAMLYRALSADQLQEAIDKRLDNRRERVETYFELRDLNDREREEDDYDITAEKAAKLAKQRAPDRLTGKELDPQSGDIQWIGPLAADALKVYRRPIEESFEKRSSPGEDYGKFDFFKVNRMVGLMQEAIDSIEDQLASREKASLNKFLDRVSFEARFNAAGERVDY